MEKSFTLTLDGTDYQVEVHGNTFVINGHPFVVGFEDEGTVIVDSIPYDITLDGETAIVEGIVHQVRVSGLDAEKRSTAVAIPTPTVADAGAIQAIMPGSIVRVLVAVGDKVTAGEVVLVLEAMKMENELRAPTSGVVRAIHVGPGQAVGMNAVLAEITPLD